jgi:hypothetical protein
MKIGTPQIKRRLITVIVFYFVISKGYCLYMITIGIYILLAYVREMSVCLTKILIFKLFKL